MMRAFLTKRWPELSLVLLGCALRLALASSYEVRLGYDFYDHARNIAWWMQHWQLPPIDWSRAAYHPPLYYALAGLLARAGVGFTGLGALSLVLGCVRLGLLATALAWYLPGQRLARIAALALAAVLPASVHMDVMVTNEPLAATLATLAIVLVPPTLGDHAGKRWLAALGLGLSMGLAILTKVSCLVVLAAPAVGVLLYLGRERSVHIRARLLRVAPAVCALGIALLVSGWYFGHCQAAYGKAFVTGFDSWRSEGSLRNADKPFWARRPAGYLVGWGFDIYAFPFYPSASETQARFFPQLVATSFADYYNYGLAPYPGPSDPSRVANQRPLRPGVVPHARLSVGAGTVILPITVAAWAACCLLGWRRRQYTMLGLLLVPALAVAGQAYFSLRVANDAEGVVKGTYLQFASAPVFAVFGLGAQWLWGKRRTLGIAACAAIAPVAWYVVFCLFFA